MSISSVGSSNPYAYLQQLLQSDSSDASDAAPPSDPLQALFQAATGGGNSSDPLLAALSPGDGSAGSISPQFSPDVMQALFSVQGAASGPSKLESLFGKFDTDGNGQISQSEFEHAIGPDADKAKVDALFNKLDGNGDGSVSQDELHSALQKAHGGGHHHHHHVEDADQSQQGSDPLQALLSGASADGTTSQSSANADGSNTTTITYADGTKVEMTTPAAATATDGDTGTNDNSPSSNPNALNFGNLLKQLISLQAQLAQPTTNLSV
jgi:hypothetical protein